MKRAISIMLIFSLALGCCLTNAFADEGIMPMASPTIMSQYAIMDPGTKTGINTGSLEISYDITAKSSATELGVSSIKLYRSDGTYITTIIGTTENGLIGSGLEHMDTYSYVGGVSGRYYYAEVTLFATIGDISDSVTITTATVKAP